MLFDIRFISVSLVILGSCMIFLSPFLDVIKMLMLTVFSSHSYNVKFVACRILFFGLFIGLQLISTLYPWFLSVSFPMSYYFCRHLFLVTPFLLMLVELCVWWITPIKRIRENYYWCHEYFKHNNSFWERTKIKYNWYLCLPLVIFDY